MIPFEQLVAWTAGDLDGAAAAPIEEHLLGCETCTRIAGLLQELGDGVRALVRSPSIVLRGHPGLVARAESEGLITRRYQLLPSGSVACAVDAEDLFTLVEYAVDPGNAARIDLVASAPGVGEQRLEDVPFDAARGMVRMLYPAEQVRALPTVRVVNRLLAVRPDGDELLGTYTLDHRAQS